MNLSLKKKLHYLCYIYLNLLNKHQSFLLKSLIMY